ncbi:MAG: hypothetical protein AABZ57_06560 [Candidatus Margulisiibacteriota bacterium]
MAFARVAIAEKNRSAGIGAMLQKSNGREESIKFGYTQTYYKR